ncbi:DUF3231 family protein [Radiobacillus kanasensis]|uniref:DUF3231 family protein n=1 Tax=Radiobacillus kanasensis TaxID=2844358 RepID=UPI001E63C2DC|nr:DUF3231 family protein [Radiobacillus kanasensis]UFU00611.1 DUF3231 family protein [Radiobacillus kanasensis]
MKSTNHNVPLTSAEIGNLWTQYMNDTMSICFLKHSIKNTQDKGIKEILQFSLRIAESHIPKIKSFLKQDDYPIPMGFTKEDVNLDAPALFTETFLLVYMHVMALHGMTGYAGAVGTSARADQRAHFIQSQKETMELYDRIISVMLHKGILSKPPRINRPSKVDFVNDQSYLAGWFGKKRPLSAMEISGLSFNMQKSIVKVVLEIGFGQVTRSKEVQKYLQKGKKICKHQFGVLSDIMTKEDLSSPESWVSEVTDSTIAPFSDKLMMFHIVTLVSAAVGYLSAGLSVSQRRDIAVEYSRLMAEMGLYAEDGAQLMIKHGWLEQPPLAHDRDEIANQ